MKVLVSHQLPLLFSAGNPTTLDLMTVVTESPGEPHYCLFIENCLFILG